jgi:hypothetical protein
MSTYTSEIEIQGKSKYHELSVEYTYTPQGAWMDYNEQPDSAQIELTEVALMVGNMERIIDPYKFGGLEEYIVEKLYDEN